MSTIALNIIVGNGEAELLDRCLRNLSQVGFDEIVVNHNTPKGTEHDLEVEKVRVKYSCKAILSKWENDFAKSRNQCIDETESDYIMFCDADDLIPACHIDGYRQMLKVIKSQIRADYFVIPIYALQYEIKANTVSKSISRTAIFRRCEAIRWKYPIHECLTLTPEMRKMVLDGAMIFHAPTADKRETSPQRNIKIFEKMDEDELDDRMKFYYARELIMHDKPKAIAFFKELIGCGTQHPLETAYSCMAVVLWGLFDEKAKIVPSMLCEAETFCRIGLGLNLQFGELYVFLGDIFNHRKNTEQAIFCYRHAMACKQRNELETDARYYKLIPAQRLSTLYFQLGNYEEALLFNKVIIETEMDETVLKKRELILSALNEELNRLLTNR